MLYLVWFPILGLSGLMFDSFWDHFGIPGPESIFRHLGFSGIPFWLLGGFILGSFGDPWARIHFQKSEVLWDSILVAQVLHFWCLGTSKSQILRVLGSLWAPFRLPFRCLEAPGHVPEGSLCSKGSLDRFWD